MTTTVAFAIIPVYVANLVALAKIFCDNHIKTTVIQVKDILRFWLSVSREILRKQNSNCASTECMVRHKLS